jgi:hypothetical protein
MRRHVGDLDPWFTSRTPVPATSPTFGLIDAAASV